MICNECGTDNLEGRKFCKECGAAMARACPACGAANEADAKFCGDCGTAFASAPTPDPSPPDAGHIPEQRFVSVLFADLVAYSTLSEHRDPEDVRDMLTVYFDRSRAIIERFGGTVDKFIGDAVMGVWGARVAQEDDAQRAVRAALELVDMVTALGEELNLADLELRAGVNSGRTSVGPGGNEKGLVVGDLVNTASRLQSIAGPGTVYVGQTTYEVTNRSIDYADEGEHYVKGKTEPVHAYRALRVAGTVAGRHEDELRVPPFTGRDPELRLLKDALAAVQGENRARLISVVGEAGIGKTRLAEEFKKHIDGYTQDIYWHWGRSPSLSEGVTFWALGEIVRRRAGIAEGDDRARSLTRLRTMLAEFVPNQDDRDWIEPKLTGLLGLTNVPEGSGPELFAALRAFFQHIARKGPTVLVFEDLHWADTALLDFISELVERSTRSPILVVTLARTDLLDRVPDWGSRHRSSMAVRLAPLPDADMRRLVSEYLPGVDGVVIDQIVKRVAGFPLYAVEIVRMLLGTGELRREGELFRYEGDPSAMALPDTLETVIGARLDRLEPAQRGLLADAAALGQTFTLDSIATMRGEAPTQVAEALAPLVKLELLDLEDDPRSPERGQYRFVQSLIREVAYHRMGRDDRRARHLAAAEYFERANDPELAGVVASHYMGAYEATPAGEARDAFAGRALKALTDAAERAAELHSNLQALALLEEAIDLAPDTALQAEIRLSTGPVASAHAEVDRGMAHLSTARAHFEEVGDPVGVRRAATAQSGLLNSHFRSTDAYDLIAPVYAGLQDVNDPVSIALAAEAARSFSLTGHSEEAIAAANRVLANPVDTDLLATFLNTLVTKATALAFTGRRLEGITMLRGAATEAEKHGYLRVAGRAMNNLSTILESDDPQEALIIGEQLQALATRVGGFGWWVRSISDVSTSYIGDGRYDEAEALLSQLDDESLSEFWRGVVAAERAMIEIRRNASSDTRDALLAAISYFDEETDPQLVAWALWAKASTHLEMGEWEKAFEFGIEADPATDWHGLWVATHAAAWLGDPNRLDRVAKALPDMPLPEFDAFVEAIVAGVNGDGEEAEAGFVEVLSSWKPRLLASNLAEARVVFARIVGTESPAAAQAAQEAHDWCVETGTNSYLNAWAPVMPLQEVTASAG